jgi:hypothetical protein
VCVCVCVCVVREKVASTKMTLTTTKMQRTYGKERRREGGRGG